MNPRCEVFKTLLLVCTAVGCAHVAHLAKAADGRPNIVFLMADDHQTRAMGCMGNREIQTPNLDKLAADGVLFRHCYATSPICLASRATVMTGMYEYRTGCNFSTGRLSAKDWNTLAYPVLLKHAGYRTAFAGKWGFPLEVPDYASSFDAWGGFAGSSQGFYQTAKNRSLRAYAKQYPHVTRALGAFARDFVRQTAGSGQPFCLSISFKAPHKPHNIIDLEDEKLYPGVRFSRPVSYGQQGLRRLSIQPKLGRQYVQRHEWDAEYYQDHLRAYYQLISGIDTAVGMIREEIHRQGIDDNTVIIYTSDNGYFCGAHGLQGKVLPYEEASSIPLILFDPRLPSAGKRLHCKSVVANIDFAPTILSLAGLDVPERMDGKNLMPLVAEPSSRVRDSLLLIQNWGWLNNDHNRGLAVVTEEWKYINWCYADKNVPPAEELYCLHDDPYEMNNRINDQSVSEVKATLQKQYDRFHQHWSKHCVDTPDYTRHRAIFDRHVPWQQKPYRTWVDRPKPNRAVQALEQAYQELTTQTN